MVLMDRRLYRPTTVILLSLAMGNRNSGGYGSGFGGGGGSGGYGGHGGGYGGQAVRGGPPAGGPGAQFRSGDWSW